jgi:hypothetical protein
VSGRPARNGFESVAVWYLAAVGGGRSPAIPIPPAALVRVKTMVPFGPQEGMVSKASGASAPASLPM